MLHNGDCLDVMAAMEPESVDAIVTDPPYGLEFMGKEWDRLDTGHNAGRWDGRRTAAGQPIRDSETPGGRHATRTSVSQPNPKCGACGHYRFSSTPCRRDVPAWIARPNEQSRRMQAWHQRWAEAAYRVAKPSAYLLAFGGTRTVHRMTVALEDAGWIIRDMLVWAYASGFPKSKASLKPAWEPIVMARKPGPLRELAIDACRIPMSAQDAETIANAGGFMQAGWQGPDTGIYNKSGDVTVGATVQAGRWPANVILTDPIFDGGVEGVVGGGEAGGGFGVRGGHPADLKTNDSDPKAIAFSRLKATYETVGYGDSGTYSRFFLIPKADRADREPVLGGLSGLPVDERIHAFDEFNSNVGNTVAARRRNSHPTVKPVDLMRHLVRLVTPPGGTVLDPFLGSGTTAIAAEMEGFPWIGIEREAEYVAIAEARLNGTQRGLGLDVA